jgi:acetylornithine deacetylase
VLAENAPVHRHLCSLVEQPQGESVAFATDAGWLQRLDLDCAIFGPGSIEVAHKPNEYLPKDQFLAASGLFSGMIRHFCLEGRA